jgi:hypothetical protein
VARVRDLAGNPGPSSLVVPLRIASVDGDADGDGQVDLVSYNPTNGRFTLTKSASPAAAVTPFASEPADVPVRGDFDGDGKMDFGFYRIRTGQWFLQQSRAGRRS